MSTETLIKREVAANTQEQPFPTVSKHHLDLAFKASQAALDDERAMKQRTNELQPFNKGKEITMALGNPRDKILRQINAGNFKVISNEEAINTPFAKAA